ncbi:hypothetical protein D9M68_572150 [compost metagenome]
MMFSVELKSGPAEIDSARGTLFIDLSLIAAEVTECGVSVTTLFITIAVDMAGLIFPFVFVNGEITLSGMPFSIREDPFVSVGTAAIRLFEPYFIRVLPGWRLFVAAGSIVDKEGNSARV